MEVRWAPFRFAVASHPELTEARIPVLVAELRAVLARHPGADPLDLEPIQLAGGQVWASPNWDDSGQLVWTLYRPQDR